MPPSFDDHLEALLKDCNDRINQLEDSNGTDEEMLEALINRGSVLSMMEYYTSALSDFEDAVDLIVEMEKDGKQVEAGSFVRVFVSRGELYGDTDRDQMAEDYSIASTRVNEIAPGSRYYDRKRIIRMCLDCSEDLLDCDRPNNASVFIEKLYSLLIGYEDNWSRNRYLETLNIAGHSMNEMNMHDEAAEYFSEAISVGYEMIEKETLEDTMPLIFALVMRGDIEKKKGMFQQYFVDRKAAISLLEELLAMNKLDDVQVLVRLHQDVASTYMSLDKIKEAEEHLMREVMLSMDGAEDYIREYVDKEE